MRRFKSKKRRKKLLCYALIYVIIVLVIVYLMFDKIYSKTIGKIDNTKIIKLFFDCDDVTSTNNNKLNLILNYTLGINSINGNKAKKIVKNETLPVNNDVNQNEPIIYIYNTHQTESYKKTNENSYNVIPTVLHASYILKNKFSDIGISSIVENTSIIDIMNANNYSYKQSYKVSKFLATEAIKNNPTIKYIIDLHRDSIPENISTILKDNKKYARVMFVISTMNPSYQSNLDLANKINDYLNDFDPKLSRGIDIKERSGLFNQDLSNNALLIEVGGEYNDIDSVSNTLELIASAFKKVIFEDGKQEET